MNKKKNICIECGLCCSGTFFPVMVLTRDVKTGLDSEGNKLKHMKDLSILGIDGHTQKPTLFLKLPCPLLKDKKCTIYEERPLTCSKYNCKLLENYNAGNKTYEEAKEIIKKKIIREFV